MQSRRNEGYMKVSPSSKIRSQHRQHEMGHEPYQISRRETLERSSPLPPPPSSQPPRARRSISPHKNDGSRRVLVGDRRSGSIERRDYGWHLGGGGRTDKVRSRSPPYGQQRKRPHFEEGGEHRKYDYVEPVEFDDGNNTRLKQVYNYDHGTSRMSKEKDYSENRTVGIDGHGVLSQKSLPVEEGVIRGSYRLPPDMVPMSNYGESGGHLPSSSRGADIGRFEHEKPRYREPIPSDKLGVMESYKEGENPMYHSRDVPYNMVPASHSKDVAGTSQFKDFGGTSSGISRSEYLPSYREGVPFPSSDEYPRDSGKLTESMGLNAYGQRPLVDTVRDPETGPRNIAYYQRGAYSPTRTERDDFAYPKPRVIANDDRGYPSDELNRMLPPRARLDYDHARMDYDHARMDYDHRDLSRPNIMHPVVGRVDDTDGSSGNLRKSTVWDHSTLQKQTVPDYVDMSRTSYASKQSGEHLGSEYTYGRRVSRDYELPHLGISQDHQIQHVRSDYGLGRGTGPEFQKERLQNPSATIYDSEMQRHAVRPQRMKDEHGMYEPSDKVLKRKYSMEEDIDKHDSRTIMSSKWNVPTDFEYLYDSGEEWIEEDMSGLNLPRTGAFDHKEYRKAERTYDGRDRPGDFASDDWLSSQDSLAHAQRHTVRYYKNSGRYIKGNPRSGSLNWHNSYHTDRRSGFHKHHKVWKRNDDYDENARANDDDQSEDWVNLAESEPSEDSEEFKQLIHEAFLKYSKKLNVNSAAQRRYKEQGKAGSLFCIVCGRSNSKEFMDTQRLVTHAFMSHKLGLRAEHLGLHKAICILLGWNTVVPQETITWVPEVLPDAEASAQREDLILWPPLVVIHNISMSNNNPIVQKVVPIEGIEAFLRGKGFVGGKIKVCLGKPADQSIMVVKFLGTFTGLGVAERLHKYFADNKRGRIEFEQKTSNGKSNDNWEAGMQGDDVEQLLYGYIGIAEDLDRLDFNSKKFSLIKSKKEIQDLANAPVKPDDR